MNPKRIRFQGKEWLLTDWPSGAITTDEAYTDGQPSYAHLYEDGRVMRWRRQIGVIWDIEILGDAEHDGPDLAGGLRMLLEGPWVEPMGDA